MKGRFPTLLGCLLVLFAELGAQAKPAPEAAAGDWDFRFTVLKYKGGGDWYEGKVGVPNLMEFLRTNTRLRPQPTPDVIEADDAALLRCRFLLVKGHGEIRFTESEVRYLREWLLAGGFLYADDDYGMDVAFRREIKRVFPEKELAPLPSNHPLYRQYFEFPQGTPKIHEHDGGPPRTLGIWNGDRLMVLYTVNTDIGDGWAPWQVHKDPEAVRLLALQFGVNVILYSMTR
ncbi:MAG: DUF4159 domain-containing protein [Spirochaetes bacterium]|nr:DUF4159 domain-containing protein [Spirochaetota bacterium]